LIRKISRTSNPAEPDGTVRLGAGTVVVTAYLPVVSNCCSAGQEPAK
jgi:hypothetical protein